VPEQLDTDARIGLASAFLAGADPEQLDGDSERRKAA
jgi:hypothetical protein